MESDYRRDDQGAARDALSVLAADRQVLADRIRTPAWYYPSLGIATALIIGSPGMGVPSQSIAVTFGCIGMIFLSLAHHRITGMTVTRMAGPKSLASTVALGLLIVLLLGLSFAFVAIGHPEWVLMTVAAAFATTWIGGRLYERAYDRELRHGR